MWFPGFFLAYTLAMPFALTPRLPLALIPGLLLGSQPYNPFALVTSSKLGLRQIGSTTSTWFSLRDWRKIQGRVSQYNHFYFLTFLHSQNPRSSHNVASILFKTKPNSWIPRNITNELLHNCSKNPRYVHPLPLCRSLQKHIHSSGPFLDIFSTMEVFLIRILLI